MAAGPEDGRPPLFLERQTYRQRRLRDAARALPVLGMLLWAIPLLWPLDSPDEGTGVTGARAFLYLFGVWLFLIVAAGLLSLGLRTDATEGRG